MFNIKDKILVCDMSNFTLGVDIVIIENGQVLNKVIAKNKREATPMVYSLCDTQGITNVFVKPLVPTDTEKMLNEFKSFGKTNYAKIVDKIRFHVI